MTIDEAAPTHSVFYVIGEVNGKLDQLITTLLPQLSTLAASDEAILVRVSALENKHSWLVGVGAAVAFIITAWEVIRVVFIP